MPRRKATTGSERLSSSAIRYFTGTAADLVTINNMIGAVAAEDERHVTADTDMMTDGALAVNPNADVVVSFVGDWADLVKGQQVTHAQVDRGVDVLIIMGNAFTPLAVKLAE